MVRAVTFTSGNGGVGKTTMALNTSDALGRNGQDVLCIDLSPQLGGLTDIAGFTSLLNHDEYDISDVLLSRDRSLREILLRGDEHDMSFDLIPANMSTEDFDQMVSGSNVAGNKWSMLRHDMSDAELWGDYDVVIIDAPAGRNLVVRNAIIATRSVILPTENDRRGRRSIPGMQDFLSDLQYAMNRGDGPNISLDLLAVVPNDTGDGKSDQRSKERYEEMDAPVTPFWFRERDSLLSDSMDEQRTALEWCEEQKYRPRPNETYTLQKFELLGEIIMEGSIDAVEDEVEMMAKDPAVKGVPQ